MVRKLRDVSFFTHALEFAASAWNGSAAKSRVSIVETLSRVVPVVVRDLAGAPDPAVLRGALRKKINQGSHAGTLTEDEAKAIAWLDKASRPMSAFEDAATVCDVLDALAVNLDGRPAAPEYFSRRPSEVAALTRTGCYLPDRGWGQLTFADSSPAAGKAFTDDGQVHEHRGLKGRTKGRPNNDPRVRRPTRKVPIPPELVILLRAHIEQFGVGADGRLFRSENSNPIQPSTWWQVWRKVRALALAPEQMDTPLLRRPYDLRHSGVTWRLNSGVPPTEVAAWAGHSVDVLMRVYAKCMTGPEDVWISRMEGALHLENDLGPQDGRPDGDPQR